MSDYRAACVPQREQMDWDEAAAVAGEWIEQECADQRVGRAPLITHTKDHLGQGSLASFARRHDWTTPRSQHRVRMQRDRPVLAYVPDAKVLDVAGSYARGSSLCAVEGFAYPLAGWAKAAGAIDLLSGETAAPSDEAIRQALDGLHFYGNNGWTRGFGADQTLRKLATMRDAGQLNKQLILGDMLARGHRHRAVARLAALIDKVATS